MGDPETIAGMARLFAEQAGPETGPFLADWPPDGALRSSSPSSLPVMGWLGGLTTPVDAAKSLLQTLIRAAPTLSWRQTYSTGDIGEDFLARYGWTELIGERGPIASDSIACGFLLLGPDVEYPLHSHEAEEIYLPIAGTADWASGTSPWRARNPGALIHHPSWVPHAMRTQAEPMLALYLWRAGDLTQKSRFLNAAGPT